jgi:hypothetical protein
MQADFRLILVWGLAIAAGAWGLVYAGSVRELVTTGTNGYVSMIHGLEPPNLGGGVAGGSGNFSQAATTGYGGAPSFYPGA